MTNAEVTPIKTRKEHYNQKYWELGERLCCISDHQSWHETLDTSDSTTGWRTAYLMCYIGTLPCSHFLPFSQQLNWKACRPTGTLPHQDHTNKIPFLTRSKSSKRKMENDLDTKHWTRIKPLFCCLVLTSRCLTRSVMCSGAWSGTATGEMTWYFEPVDPRPSADGLFSGRVARQEVIRSVWASCLGLRLQ